MLILCVWLYIQSSVSGSTSPEDPIRGCEGSYLKDGWEPSLFMRTRELLCRGQVARS
jgi:hypothetical protein